MLISAGKTSRLLLYFYVGLAWRGTCHHQSKITLRVKLGKLIIFIFQRFLERVFRVCYMSKKERRIHIVEGQTIRNFLQTATIDKFRFCHPCVRHILFKCVSNIISDCRYGFYSRNSTTLEWTLEYQIDCNHLIRDMPHL